VSAFIDNALLTHAFEVVFDTIEKLSQCCLSGLAMVG
jgi:hypothetical protein